eukprot:m.18829 g.18829  ORF g.18829 m.18829 type:complete len:849 (-) comp5020_c0_seq1:1035-3581(-)
MEDDMEGKEDDSRKEDDLSVEGVENDEEEVSDSDNDERSVELQDDDVKEKEDKDMDKSKTQDVEVNDTMVVDDENTKAGGFEAVLSNLKKKFVSNERLDVDDLYVFVDSRKPALLTDVGGVQAVANRLGTHLEHGLNTSDVESLREQFGENRLPPPKFKSFLSLVWDAMTDRTLIMLSIAALISFTIGIVTDLDQHGYKDGVAVFVAVIIVVAITSLNDYQKEKQFRRLNDVKNNHDVTVIRNGQRIRESIFDVVVGDIVCVQAGDVIPADGIFVSGESIQTDESSATGESDTVKKGHPEDNDPYFLSGTQVINGSGTMLILCVGNSSFHGRIMIKLRTEDQDTPLQEKLSKLANLVGNFGAITALVIFTIQLIKYFAVEGADVDRDQALNNVVDCLIIAISIVVVAVPEGLPLAVTIALAYSMKHMMKDNNLVRRLEACETMGGATTVCSDKTGTLTQNKMTVVQGFVFQTAFNLNEGLKLDVDEKGQSNTISGDVLRLLFEGLSVNSTAYESIVDEESGEVAFIGSKTETALLNFIKLFGYTYTDFRNKCNIVQMYTFSSAKKHMTTIVQLPDNDQQLSKLNSSNMPFLAYTKGAAEMMVALSSHVITRDGTVLEMNSSLTDEIQKQLDEFSSQSLRAIGMAFKFTSSDNDCTEDKEPNMVFMGIVGLQDPLRPEIKYAVEACTNAGVVVRMVTGDAAATAINIGKSCGIYDETKGHVCMEGPEFRHKTDDELVLILPQLRVLARSSPTDKFKLVSMLQQMNEVVAVTGDGVNDGPALKQANVGFSMGLSGTDVAKEASTIVLLDDNFASIVNAIKWGRSVFDNIRKFLQFQLTVNFTAIIIILLL